MQPDAPICNQIYLDATKRNYVRENVTSSELMQPDAVKYIYIYKTKINPSSGKTNLKSDQM